MQHSPRLSMRQVYQMDYESSMELPDRWCRLLSTPGALVDCNDRDWRQLTRAQQVGAG